MKPRHQNAYATVRLAMPRPVVGAAIASLGLAVVLSIAPPTPAHAAGASGAASAAGVAMPASGTRTVPPVVPDFAPGTTQDYAVGGEVSTPDVTRDASAATSPDQLYIAGGTNEDWAKLVLYYGGWPQSEANVTVMMQWMVRENGPDSWWLRNNPLNNGWGSGGGGGFGRYDTLDTAAFKVAENLNRGGIYQAIIDCFAASCPSGQTAQAIWESPWASSHYGNGSRWTTGAVRVVQAPVEEWR